MGASKNVMPVPVRDWESNHQIHREDRKLCWELATVSACCMGIAACVGIACFESREVGAGVLTSFVAALAVAPTALFARMAIFHQRHMDAPKQCDDCGFYPVE